MEDYENMSTNQLPKSEISDNTYKNFTKICRAYYKEMMTISKNPLPSLSKDDVIVVDDIIKEISSYSTELTQKKFTKEAGELIELGIHIVDNLIKIFQSANQQKSLFDKINYPLTLKLILLEAAFRISFNYEHNYPDSEKILNDIIELQNYLKLPLFNLACSTFYLGVLKFYAMDIDKAEDYSNQALTMLEQKENAQGNDQYENRKTSKMSNILEFLATIYNLRKDYHKEIANYERAYYLNLGRYGGTNVNTEYYQKKLEIANEELKKLSHYTPLQYSKTPQLTNQNYPMSSTSFSSKKNDLSTTNYNNTNIIHKGKADTYSFVIPTTSFCEPLVVSIYSISHDDSKKYSPENFVCTLLFGKLPLLKFLQDKEGSNNLIYSDLGLNKILSNITLINGYITFLNASLEASLINSNKNQSTNFPAIRKKR